MRILFVYSLRDVLTAKRPLASLGDIHIGLSYISACLKARHHSTRLVVLDSERQAASLARLMAEMETFDPQLVGFTAVSTQLPFIQLAAAQIKQRWPGKFLLLGGAHASLRPDETITGPFDALCIGEGEMPTVELAEQLAAGRTPGGISNLWFKRPDGSVEKNPAREFLADLDGLPLPDRELWEDWVMAKSKTNHVVQPSRGCPFNCSYCSNHALRKIAGGKYVRLRSPASVVQEIRHLQQRYPELQHIYLQSETIAVNLKWLQELSQQLQELNQGRKEALRFSCNFRVSRQLLTEEVFEALERAGVRTIEIGLESGSERIRAEVLRRSYTNAEFVRAVEMSRRHGFKVNVYNMIGLPGETPADHEETVALNHQVCPDQSLTSIFFPYPGTDLYETCIAQGLLRKQDLATSERWRATLELPSFSRKQVQHAFDWFEFRVYQGHWSLSRRLRKAVRNKLKSNTWSNLLFMRCLPLWHALRGEN